MSLNARSGEPRLILLVIVPNGSHKDAFECQLYYQWICMVQRRELKKIIRQNGTFNR